jgi:hypothetical protein
LSRIAETQEWLLLNCRRSMQKAVAASISQTTKFDLVTHVLSSVENNMNDSFRPLLKVSP